MTISEIAKMAGVSPAAVSRYLNRGYISAEKTERIREVIERTGYVPSAQARTLRTKKTMVIGVILPKIDSESVSRMVSGISQELSTAGYELLLASTANSPDKEMGYLKMFDHSRVDGIIFIATMMTPEHEEVLKELKVPVVMVGQEETYISCIYHDDFGAAKALTKCLLSGPHRCPGYIGVTTRDKAAGLSRLRGFEAALKEEGLSIQERAMVTGEFTIESGYECAKKLLKQAPDTNTIFCATDTIAVGALTYLKEAKKRIPEDVSIGGIGHTKMSRVVTPSLTTVHFYYKTAGIEAAKMLLEKLEKEDTPNKQMKLSFEVINQDSVLK